MVELMQRLSLEPTTVTIDRSWDVNCWGIGDFYDGDHVLRGDRDDFRIVYGYVEEELVEREAVRGARHPRPQRLVALHPEDARRDPAARERGRGPRAPPPLRRRREGPPVPRRRAGGRRADLGDLAARGRARRPRERPRLPRAQPGGDHARASGGRGRTRSPRASTSTCCPRARAGGRFYRYQAQGRRARSRPPGFPVVATRTYGKGRVVAFATVGDGFIPEADRPREDPHVLGLLGVPVLPSRARRAVGGAREGRAEHPQARGDGRVRPDPRPRRARLPARSRSRRGRGSETATVLGHGDAAPRPRRAARRRLEIPASDLAPAGWPGGRSVVDVIVRDPATGATLQWGWAGLEAPKAASLSGLRPNATVYREGDTMSLVARAAGDLAGLTRARALRRRPRPPAGGRGGAGPRASGRSSTASTTSSASASPSRPSSWTRRGGSSTRCATSRVVVAARERRQKEYRGLLSFETPVHYFAEQRLRRAARAGHGHRLHLGRRGQRRARTCRAAGSASTGTTAGPRRPRAWRRRSPSSRRRATSTRSPYLVKKELYRRTGETRFLVRSPSFDDPAACRSASSTSRAPRRGRRPSTTWTTTSSATRARSAPTPTPVDFCWGTHTLAGFRAWLREQYGSLDALNRVVGERLPRLGRRRCRSPPRRRGARAASRPGRTTARTWRCPSPAPTRRCATASVEGDPEGHIALSGTQVTNPWNGCDWHRLDAVIDDFLSYSGGNQWDIHRSFAKPGARIGFWTGYGRSGAAVKHEVWTAALQGVLHPQLFWSPSIVNPDMTFSRSGRDLGEAFQALRFEGIGRLLMEAERARRRRRRPLLDALRPRRRHPRPPRPRGGEEGRHELPGEPRRLGERPRRPGPVVPLPGGAAGRGGRAPGEARLRPARTRRRSPTARWPRSAASWRRAASSSPTARPASSTSTSPGARRARSTRSSA